MDYPIRVHTHVLNRWLAQEVEPIFRESVVLGKLRSLGRIKQVKAGTKRLDWRVRYLRRQIRDIAGPVTETTFPNTSTRVACTLEPCGYDMGESITKLERLVAGPHDGLTGLFQEVMRALMDDFTEGYRLRVWQDGTITGTGLMGILSMFGGSSTPHANGIYSRPGTYTCITCADAATSWWACSPSQTYAGLSTALGNKVNDYSHSNTSEAWPLGTFSEGYHYFSPLMVDYNNTLFGGTAANWDYQWQQACNALMTYMQVIQTTPVDLIVWDPDLERRAKDSLRDQQQFVVTESSPTRALGFKSLEYNGAEFLREYGVPAGMGFALRFNKMTLHNWQSQLIATDEDEDIVTSESLKKLDCYTQLQCDSPAFFGALVPASTAGT